MISSTARFWIALTGITIVSTGFASAQIVALGHSAVRDQAVSESEMWPAVLERMLRAKGSNVRVTNAGVWGETTDRTLARVSSDVPNGTMIVILMDNGYNDAHQLAQGAANAAANIAAIKQLLAAGGIKVIDAMGIYDSVLRQPGMAVADHLHLSVEGNKRVAAKLAATVR
jgi:acyl-CoA thioesterase-1